MCLYLYRRYRKRQQQQQNDPQQTQSKQKPEAKSNGKACPHRTAAEAAQASQKCLPCASEKSAARKYRWKLLLLLLPGFFLASLDLTIVATALPFIASHFGEVCRCLNKDGTNTCRQI